MSISPGTRLGTHEVLALMGAGGMGEVCFGAVLYEMLAGRRAFVGDTTARVMSAVLRDDPPALQTPPALERIVRRRLAKQPAERFRAMGDVKTALEHVSLKL
jgi:eukaryotic-like serine/threonine-protein kinase